jgi:hypothetical protein
MAIVTFMQHKAASHGDGVRAQNSLEAVLKVPAIFLLFQPFQRVDASHSMLHK